MSCQRGNCSKSGQQKYKNTRAFRNDLYQSTKTVKSLNALKPTGCCKRCTEIIEWKIKYSKYKVMTNPKKCVKCQQKSVKNSYYIICQNCIESKHLCGKCCESLPDPTTVDADDRETKLCGKNKKNTSENMNHQRNRNELDTEGNNEEEDTEETKKEKGETDDEGNEEETDNDNDEKDNEETDEDSEETDEDGEETDEDSEETDEASEETDEDSEETDEDGEEIDEEYDDEQEDGIDSKNTKQEDAVSIMAEGLISKNRNEIKEGSKTLSEIDNVSETSEEEKDEDDNDEDDNDDVKTKVNKNMKKGTAMSTVRRKMKTIAIRRAKVTAPKSHKS